MYIYIQPSVKWDIWVHLERAIPLFMAIRKWNIWWFAGEFWGMGEVIWVPTIFLLTYTLSLRACCLDKLSGLKPWQFVGWLLQAATLKMKSFAKVGNDLAMGGLHSKERGYFSITIAAQVTSTSVKTHSFHFARRFRCDFGPTSGELSMWSSPGQKVLWRTLQGPECAASPCCHGMFRILLTAALAWKLGKWEGKLSRFGDTGGLTGKWWWNYPYCGWGKMLSAGHQIWGWRHRLQGRGESGEETYCATVDGCEILHRLVDFFVKRSKEWDYNGIIG